MGRKKDYQNKSFKNPYFAIKNKKKITLRFRYFLPVIIIFLGGFFYFITSERFEIKNIKITGNQNISQTDIKNEILNQMEKRNWLFFKQDNIIFFNKSKTKEQLMNNYFFDNVKINKSFFNTLKVEVKEKESLVIWASNGEKHYLSLDGEAIRKLTGSNIVIKEGGGGINIVRSEASQGNYPLVKDESNSSVVIGDDVLSKERVDFIINLTKAIEFSTDFGISYFLVNKPVFQDITLITKEGWQARFKASDNPLELVNILNLVLSQKVRNRSNLEYVDLRFGEKIFYK